jgi:hypothetical protein
VALIPLTTQGTPLFYAEGKITPVKGTAVLPNNKIKIFLFLSIII